MAITKPPVLPSWAEAGDKIQPSNAEIQAGWPLSSIPPSRQRFNWLLNFLANGIRYFSRRGLPDYDAAETYMTGDRIIGDDGKTYRSLIDNNIGQTPSAQPTKWERWGFTFSEFAASVTTPPQFDNDTSLATTAFVQRALGSYRGFAPIANGATITALEIGQTLQPADGATVNFPAPASLGLRNGDCVTILMGARTAATLAATGGAAIAVASGNVTSLSLVSFETITLMAGSGTTWVIAHRGLVGNTQAYSIGTIGYQKLPSGLIIQWGSKQVTPGSVPAYFNFDVVFPIAFPTTALQIVTSTGVNTVDLDGNASWRNALQQANVGIPSATGCEINMYIENAVSQDRRLQYIAIGY